MADEKALRVLIAEDNPNLRRVIVNIVRKLGYSDVTEAEDGEKAWDEILKGGIGLLLTDWRMPELNGLELLKRIRQSAPPISTIPVLMITAADTKNEIVTAGKFGVDAYVVKPFNIATIGEKIQEAFRKRPPR
ncbi:MAG: response regulator [Candidatus Lambdaproteobacteria bacterium]|nr:response regulator [Candidatus Lambdaproteobacteria bacterium]